ncbi:hypothetical protein DFH94DRAFT_354245 [Russula ochroleuca]|uniref:Transmembrane protein n=1 Tax=Russula ochroleuca TaxID=152965 RepID=A0A9P5JWE6_9AGAM|nr:hypothetical protein DFH94DRAFT_354245 [Russula ochroleuca]
MALLRVAAPLASLFFFSAFSVAQVFAPSCTSAKYQWTFNSLTQSPCTVIVNLMATCDGGKYTLSPLAPGYVYYGPYGVADADLCYCNTVGYSLFSACGACQGQEWITWSEWVTNCTKVLPPSSFPNPVPSGIRVPHWALLDVSNENDWNPNKSYYAGDTPEAGPGSLISPSSVPSGVSTTPTYSLNPSSTGSPTPLPGGGSSNTGAIAGGVVGGVAVIAAAIAAIFYLRRRSRATSAVSAGVGASQSQQPLSDEVVPPSSSGSPTTMRFYDPNDRTTFPGYQGSPHSPDILSQAPMSSYIGTRSTLGNTQTSLPQAMGYHGHPTV